MPDAAEMRIAIEYQYSERNAPSTFEHIDVLTLAITQKIGFNKNQ